MFGGDPTGEMRRIQRIELRIVFAIELRGEFDQRRIAHAFIGELRRQHLAVHQRRGDDVTQAHLRIQRAARRIGETALHIDHL